MIMQFLHDEMEIIIEPTSWLIMKITLSIHIKHTELFLANSMHLINISYNYYGKKHGNHILGRTVAATFIYKRRQI